MSGIAVLGSLSLIVACGGSDSGDSVSASELASDSVDLVTEKWYVWWAGDDGAAVATAESLNLAIEDVVDRNCIEKYVRQFSAEDLAIEATGEIADLSDAGYEILDQLRNECIDFAGD